MWRTSSVSLGLMVGTVLALLFAAQSSCILNDDFLRVSDTFPCANDGDCGEPGFACDPSSLTCKRQSEIILCTDQDGDGYGAGEIRDECENSEEDPNDNDPDVNPGAAEVCDAKDNNGDGNTDEPYDCTAGGETACATELMIPLSNTRFTCRNNQCVLISSQNSAGECADVTIPCVGGTYDDTEAVAKGCITR